MPSLGCTGALLSSRIWPQHGPSFRARLCQVYAICQKSPLQCLLWPRRNSTHLRGCLVIMNGTPARPSQGGYRLYLILLPSRRSSWVLVFLDGLRGNTSHLPSSTRHPGDNDDREFLKCDRQKMWGSLVMTGPGCAFDPPNHFHTFRQGFCCVAGQQEAKKNSPEGLSCRLSQASIEIGCRNFKSRYVQVIPFNIFSTFD